MKTMICLLALVALLPLSTQATPREVFKIEIGSDYENYSTTELRRRVWELERAVYQLQEQVFQLAMNNNKRPKYGNGYGNKNTWTCSIQSFGKTFTSTKSSQGAAKAEVLKDCSSATNAMHCDREDIKCEM